MLAAHVSNVTESGRGGMASPTGQVDRDGAAVEVGQQEVPAAMVEATAVDEDEGEHGHRIVGTTGERVGPGPNRPFGPSWQ
jgi:hypothetical protein